jgi:hypothetical protein
MKIGDQLVPTDTSGDIKYSPCFKYGKNKCKMGEKKDGSILCKVPLEERNEKCQENYNEKW